MGHQVEQGGHTDEAGIQVQFEVQGGGYEGVLDEAGRGRK